MDFSFPDIYVKQQKLVMGGSFSLPEKGLFVIQGKNGVGKSLLMNVLFDQKRNDGDNVVFIDQSNNRLLLKSDVLENIAFSDSPEKISNVAAILEQCDFSELADHNIKTMSGGEKRQVCLLRGLLNSDASICFVDEPSNDLDYLTVQKINQMIQKKAETSLVLIVSHDERITKLADGLLTIQESRLVSQDVSIHYNDSPIQVKPVGAIIKKSHNHFLSKQFVTMWGTLVLVLLLNVLTFFLNLSISYVKMGFVPQMKDNQIDIYIPVSQKGLEIQEESLPIGLVSLYNNDTDIIEVIRELQSNESEKRSITFNLHLSENDDMYQLYPIEYYDVSAHSCHSVMDQYLELTNTSSVDTSNYFECSFIEQSGNDNLQKVDLNIETYREIIDCYQDNLTSDSKPYEMIFCSVVMKDGYSILDFFQSNEILGLLDGNYMIRCNETIKIINNAKLFQIQKASLLVILLYGTLLIVFEFFYIVLYMRLSRNRVRIFRNMAVSQETTLSVMMHSMKNRMFFGGSVLLSITIWISFVLYYLSLNQNISSYLFVFLFVDLFCIMVAYLLSKAICKSQIAKIYDWRYR